MAFPSLSCDPEDLYRTGRFPAGEDERAALGGGAAGERVGAVFPAFAGARPPDFAEMAGSPAFVAEMTEIQARAERPPLGGAACDLYRLVEATLFGSVLYVRRAGRPHVVYETHRPQDRATTRLALPAELDAAETAPEGLALFLGTPGSGNYGHWLVDDLPRYAAFRLLRARYPDRPITVVLTAFDPVMNEMRRQSLDLLLGADRNWSLRLVAPDAAIQFPDLHYATPVTVHPHDKSPEALRGLAAALRAATRGLRFKAGLRTAAENLAAGRAPRWRRRLFVDRRPTRSRALTNVEAVWDVLAPLGFTRVDPEGMSFRRQVETFADAELVVGTMGAAMTNTLVCAPGTSVVHLAPDSWPDPFFWDLAGVLGHRYRAVYGTAHGPEGTYYRPFTIDPELLRRVLAGIGPRSQG